MAVLDFISFDVRELFGHIMHMNSYLVIPDSIARYF